MDDKININHLLGSVANKGGITIKEARKLYQNIHSAYCHKEDKTITFENLEKIESKNDFGDFIYIGDRIEVLIHFSRSQAICKKQRIDIVTEIIN